MHDSTPDNGFSLLEFILVVTLIAVLALISVPSFTSMVNSARVNANGQILQIHLAFARGYALNQRASVEVCPRTTPDSMSCARGQNVGHLWRNGWLVYTDKNNDQQPQPAEILRSQSSVMPSNLIFNQRGRLRFFADGTSRSAAFYLCNPHTQQERYVALLYSGRFRAKHSLNKHQRRRCFA